MTKPEDRPDIDAGIVLSLLDYDKESGTFLWKRWMGGNAHANTVAGRHNSNGHVQIQIRGKKYMAHRLAWLCVHGCWPENQIDHINGIRDDNRIENLRQVTNALNMQNQKRPQKTNSSGFLGVYKKRYGYGAKIQCNGKSIYLGSFKTPEKAHERYLQEKRKIHVTNTI